LREVTARPGPYLILPNHPGYMDPANVFRALWGTFRMRPMLAEKNFRSPFLAPFGWLLRAIKVPETDRASAEAKRRAEAAGRAGGRRQRRRVAGGPPLVRRL